MNKTPGQIAYEAYCAHTNNKSLITGLPLPTWDEQNPYLKAAWEASAKAVLDELVRLTLPTLPDAARQMLIDALSTEERRQLLESL